MFTAAKKFLNDRIFGILVHEYDKVEVKHGAVTCTDTFEIRDKKGVPRLFHDRVWQDGHTVKRFSSDHVTRDVETLRDLFSESVERISRDETHDFGVVLEERNSRMQSRESFYIEAANGECVLYCRIDSTVDDSVIGESSSSDNVEVTYFPPEEVAAIAQVLTDAAARML